MDAGLSIFLGLFFCGMFVLLVFACSADTFQAFLWVDRVWESRSF